MDGVLFFGTLSSHRRFSSLAAVMIELQHRIKRAHLGWLSIVLATLGAETVAAQSIEGSLAQVPHRPSLIRLLKIQGADRSILDSARIDRRGKFHFQGRAFEAGFYELAVNDSDRVDLILDPREEVVELSFSGLPLQNHIAITRSVENQRLWEYKWVSRESQAMVSALRAERQALSPQDDMGLSRLDSLERILKSDQRRALARLVDQDTSSYFAHVVNADRDLMVAVPLGANAIANSFNWSDRPLLHSSIYPKALMAYMESAASDPALGLETACDSILKWAATDTSCWRYARLALVKLFDEYGPDYVAQHLVDRYVAGPSALLGAEPELLALVQDLLRVSIGAPAPEVSLSEFPGGPTTRLSDLTKANPFTAMFFYSSTCEHCHDQMPALRELYADLHERGFELIGIALDTDSSEFATSRSVERLVWPTFTDLIGWGSPAAKAFAVKSTPSFFLLDRMGRIVAKPYDAAELRELLKERLP